MEGTLFENVQDDRLLVDCKIAVKTEKRSTARVLEYLGEIDRRRLWLKEGYSSLFDFCIRYLNYSEGETNRRIQACRASEKVQAVVPMLEQGTLSLTVLSLLSPILTRENAHELLPQVANQSARTVEKIIAERFPERRVKEMFKAELDDELKGLLEEAKLLASEKSPAALLKKVLQSYVRERKTRRSAVKRHTHYVPKSIAKAVKTSDGRQCTFIGPTGTRCNQTAHIQIDHIRPDRKSVV